MIKEASVPAAALCFLSYKYTNTGYTDMKQILHLKEEDEDDAGSDGEPDHPPPAHSGNHQHPEEDNQYGAGHPENLENKDFYFFFSVFISDQKWTSGLTEPRGSR